MRSLMIGVLAIFILLPGTIVVLAESQCDKNGSCPGGVCPTQPRQQWQAPQRIQRAPVRRAIRAFVCRIRNTTRRSARKNSYCYGSGTLIAKGRDYGVVVTARHIFDDGTDDLTVHFPDGQVCSAKPIVIGRKSDLACLLVTPRPNSPIATIATDYPKQGERLSFAGYGKDGQYREVSGTLIGYCGENKSNSASNMIDMTGGARQGDSGGPLLNSAGELVGVISSTDARTTQGTYNGQLCKFVAENRYLFPWNADLADKKDARKHEANKPPDFGPIRLPGEQPPQQAPPVDLSQINKQLSDLAILQKDNRQLIDYQTTRLTDLESTADKARQLAEGWPELQAAMKKLEITVGQASENGNKAVESVTAVAGLASEAVSIAGEAVSIAGEANATVDAALDEDAPDGLVARLRSRIHDRLQSTITAKLAAKAGLPVGPMFGLIAIAIVAGFWFLKREVDRAQNGQQILAQRLADKTNTPLDNVAANALAAGMKSLADRLEGKKGV